MRPKRSAICARRSTANSPSVSMPSLSKRGGEFLALFGEETEPGDRRVGEELPPLEVIVDDPRLARASGTRRCQRHETSLRRTDPHRPTDRIAHRSDHTLEAAVQRLEPGGLEEQRARGVGIALDLGADPLDRPKHPLPAGGRSGRIRRDEFELRAAGEGLADRQTRSHRECLGGGRDLADHRAAGRRRSERDRLAHQGLGDVGMRPGAGRLTAAGGDHQLKAGEHYADYGHERMFAYCWAMVWRAGGLMGRAG